MNLEDSTACIICFSKNPSKNQQESLLISQTICKIFDIQIQDNFESWDFCPNCSSQIVNIHKILQELDQAKLQLEEIIIKNSAFSGDGNQVLDQNSAAEIARNEIIKRIKPCISPVAVNIKIEGQDVLNEVLDDIFKDPDWNLSDADNYESECHKDFSKSKSQENIVNPEELLQKKYQLKTPVLNIKRLPQSKFKTLRSSNRDTRSSSKINKSSSFNLDEKEEPAESLLYQCSKCPKSYKLKKILNEHMIDKHGDRSLFKCPICKAQLNTRYSIRQHTRRKHGVDWVQVRNYDSKQRDFGCEYCSKQFFEKDHLQHHVDKFHPNGATIKCLKCDKEFKNRQYLIRHSRNCNKKSESTTNRERKWKCPKCPRSYSTCQSFHSHLSNKHVDMAQLKCPIANCGKQMTNRISIRVHVQVQHGLDWRSVLPEGLKKRNFKCPYEKCKFKFYTEVTLNKHIAKAHTEPSKMTYCCEICGKILKNEITLKHHMKLHNAEEFTNFCEFCGKGFVSSGRLRLHITSHEKKSLNPPKLTCNICNEEFSDEHSLWSHNLKHKRLYVTENDPSHLEVPKNQQQQDSSSNFCCEICGEFLKRKFSLNAHMACVHGIGTSKYTCQICSRAMANSSALHNHLKSHKMKELGKNREKVKPFKCTKENCSKSFRDQHTLKIHVASKHENAFSCSFCDKNLCSLSALKNHIKDRHKSDEELKYPCSHCTRRFFDESRLNVHIKWHEKKVKLADQKFKCEVCQKDLTSIGGLRIHLRTHTGEKPFSCRFCDRKFHIKNLMLNHEACHSDEKNFQCTVCNKSFKLTRYLSRHKLNSPGCRLAE